MCGYYQYVGRVSIFVGYIAKILLLGTLRTYFNLRLESINSRPIVRETWCNDSGNVL